MWLASSLVRHRPVSYPTQSPVMDGLSVRSCARTVKKAGGAGVEGGAMYHARFVLTRVSALFTCVVGAALIRERSCSAVSYDRPSRRASSASVATKSPRNALARAD